MFSILLAAWGCGSGPGPSPEGTWRAVLTTPGGELPFLLEINAQGAVIRNGPEVVPFSSVERDGSQVVLRMEGYDSAIHATWEDGLPDPWEMVGLTNDEGRLQFTFPDLDGTPVSLSDPRFAGEVVVSLFGTWCPNCNDEAPILARWQREYQEQSLQVVGLAYEFTGDVGCDRRMMRLYAKRHGLEFPLLLAGISDKTAASATLPDLTAVPAYPTTVFVGRDGRVRNIHTGFEGPGTGEHHEKLVAGMEAIIEELLAEPAPSAGS